MISFDNGPANRAAEQKLREALGSGVVKPPSLWLEFWIAVGATVIVGGLLAFLAFEWATSWR